MWKVILIGAYVLAVASTQAFANSKPLTDNNALNLNRTPLTHVAACLPAGGSCNGNGDCCGGVCDPKHHKCSGR